MRRRLSLILLSLLTACGEEAPVDPPIEAYDPLPLVDPLIGTGGVGGGVIGLNPGATVPFGMTQVGPDTRDSSTGAPQFYHFGGYYYPDDLIVGFSHEHADGMGTNEFGDLMLMPRSVWTPQDAQGHLRAAPFSHEREQASPGYYAVTLDDDGTTVEIAATEHGAAHRYRFEPGSEPAVVIDFSYMVGDVHVQDVQIDADLDAGAVDLSYRWFGGYSSRIGGLQSWAHLAFDPLPLSTGTWTDPESPQDGSAAVSGPEGGGMWLVFPAGTEEVNVTVALSHVDAAGARANHAAELEGRDLDTVREAAEQRWRDELSSVRVRGGTDEERVIFHTALYHASMWPNVFSDVDGRYRGLDGEVHEADFRYRTNFSMWDTFRTVHPWFTLAKPAQQRDMARSLVRMYADGGSMPRWPLAHGYTGGMVGTPAAQILAGSYLKGVDGWDAEAGFEGCFRAATEPVEHAGRGGLESYQELGWVPADEQGGSVSLGLEYSWNDHALALWAEALGKDAEAELLWAQADNWKNYWDPDQGFLVGRYADGEFADLVDPEYWTDEFVEGDAWHYLWGAPQDPLGMVALQDNGDVGAFLDRLEIYWANVYAEPDDNLVDSFYWHGNEPDLHYPWLGALLGAPDLTVEPVRHVMATRYSSAPDGLDGNDDAGTLSAWYLFAAAGIYPIAGTTTYALGVPLFQRVEIDRPDGTLVIRTEGDPGDLSIPNSVLVGGERWGYSTMPHDTLIDGGELVFSWSS